MRFTRNADKETISILIRENKRLKRENQRLHESLEELERYKIEYRNLINEINQVKESYVKKMKDFDKLEKEYRKELDIIINKK